MGTTEVGSGPVERKAPSREKKKPDPVFTKKENATIAQRIEILDWYHKHSGPKKSQVKTAAHFDKIYPNLRLKQLIISDWVRNEMKWNEMKWQKEWTDQQSLGKAANLKHMKQTEHPQVNEMLELWVAKAMRDGVRVMGEVLQQKWHKFADLKNIPWDERLTLSEGWLTAFKRRCGLKEFRTHREAGSVDPAKVEIECKRIHKLIQKYGYQLKDIFNMDETGLFYA
jgi:Tc5 transposase DNA-binding domain